MQLLSTFMIHNVFHVSRFWPYIADDKVQPPPTPVFEEDASYEVEHKLHTKIEGLVLAPRNYT